MRLWDHISKAHFTHIKSFFTMIKKQITVFVLALFVGSIHLSAQGGLVSYRSYTPFKLVENQKPNAYSKQMNDLQQRGNRLGALANAFLLKKYGKKRHIKKADQFLEANYQANIAASTREIQQLETSTQSYSNEISAQQAGQLLAAYKNMVTLQGIIKDLGESYQLTNYTSKIEQAEQVHSQYRKKTAQFYYDEVLAGRGNAQSKADFRLLGYKLIRALKYEKRDDISQLYKEIQVLATTSLGVGNMTNQIRGTDISIQDAREKLYYGIKGAIKPSGNRNNPMPLLPFFELVENSLAMSTPGADLLVEVKLQSASVKKEKQESTSKEVSQSEGEGDNKRTYKATINYHSKTSTATITGSYAIKDRKTGQVIRSNSITAKYEWRDYWDTYSGSIKALTKKQQKRVERKEQAYPPDSDIITIGVSQSGYGFLHKVSEEVANYAKTIGQ